MKKDENKGPVKAEVTGLSTVTLLGNNAFEGKWKYYYQQGREGARIDFQMVCDRLPVGSMVSFQATNPGPVPPIKLEPVQVRSYPRFLVGISIMVPANYESEIIWKAVLPEGKTPEPGTRISSKALYVFDQNS